MQCECGGVLTEGKSSYRVSEENFFIIFENIPAFQCTRCNKVLFSDEIVNKIQKLVHRIKKDTSEIVTGRPSVNLYDY
jgi:YgiT-type zinc finger domain-containing protein